MDIEDVQDGEGTAALRSEWDRLYAVTPDASPFLSPAWLTAWSGGFLARAPWLLALREGGELVGVAGFYIHVRPEDGRRQLTLLGNGISDRLGLLSAPGREAEVAAAVVAHLRRRSTSWDEWDFRDLEAGSALLSAGLPPGLHEVRTAEAPCPAVPLPAEPGEVIGRLPRKRRENLQRRARRLGEQGAFSFQVADETTWPGFLDALFRLHGERWGDRGEAGVLAEPRVQAFHRAAAPGLLAQGGLRLHGLRFEGRLVAVHYGFHRGARAYSYIHGFDPALAAFGPSALLIAHVMEEAVRAGAVEFDFLRGREPYKYDWGAQDLPQYRRQVWRDDPRPRSP